MTQNPLLCLTKRSCLLFLTLPILLLCDWWRTVEFRPSPPLYADNSVHRGDVSVLLWHWPFGVKDNLEGYVCLERSNTSRCMLSSDRSTFPRADLVVFHNRELVTGQQALPFHLPRPPKQRWVWMSLEAPVNNGNMRPLAGIFNLTMSYRRDADITIPYGTLEPREPGATEEPILRNKTVPVCWVVSNFNPGHRRSQVYEQLREIVPVTVYGRWNKRSLSEKDLLPTISQCYFYLAFENSESRDYITEKLWRNAYKSGSVPVVLGPPLSDYKAVVPGGSFIHVDEFVSAGDLGRRLKELMSDKRSYEGFLRWQKVWRVKHYTSWRERLCKICSQFDSLPRHKVYKDLQAWEDI